MSCIDFIFNVILGKIFLFLTIKIIKFLGASICNNAWLFAIGESQPWWRHFGWKRVVGAKPRYKRLLLCKYLWVPFLVVKDMSYYFLIAHLWSFAKLAKISKYFAWSSKMAFLSLSLRRHLREKSCWIKIEILCKCAFRDKVLAMFILKNLFFQKSTKLLRLEPTHVLRFCQTLSMGDSRL